MKGFPQGAARKERKGNAMTLRHLKIFVAVCEEESITAAARKLYIAQPSVSFAIGELEEHYGVKLFDRISRRLYITEPGKQLLSRAREILAIFSEMEQGIRDWDSIGTLRIGTSITAGTCFLPEVAKKFYALRPQIQLQVSIENSRTLEERVLSNQVDFAIIEGLCHSDKLVAEPLMKDRLVFVCGKDHPLYETASISPDRLREFRFLLRDKGSGTRELVDSILTAHGLSILPAWESISTGALVSAVVEGIGVSILPERLVRRALKQGTIHAVEIEGISFPRNFFLIYHEGKYLSASAREFMELCRQAEQEEKDLPLIPPQKGEWEESERERLLSLKKK